MSTIETLLAREGDHGIHFSRSPYLQHDQNADHCGRTFLREYTYQGRLPQVKRQIVEMTLNGSGVRDIARVLQISPTTVIEELKKRPHPSSMSTKPSQRGA